MEFRGAAELGKGFGGSRSSVWLLGEEAAAGDGVGKEWNRWEALLTGEPGPEEGRWCGPTGWWAGVFRRARRERVEGTGSRGEKVLGFLARNIYFLSERAAEVTC